MIGGTSVGLRPLRPRPVGTGNRDAERVSANGERARAMREGLRIYNLFPTLAGPIAGWTVELPRIAAMAFNAVYINPFHYPGFSGSLYAVKDYYRLNPRFRGKAKGPDDALLRGFTEKARGHGLRVIMDLVVNHTAKDSELTASRPGWFTSCVTTSGAR